ncbi:MAG: hypothetical protein Q4G02_00570 [bacterium]|nr:hypothetical protein [bacterium]
MSDFWRDYYRYLQVLTLAIFCYVLVFLIWQFVPPAQIANWPLPDCYLPFQAILFAGNFFFFTFLTQNRRFGLYLATIIYLWLFFKLQHFVFTLPLILAWAISSIGLFFLLCYNSKKSEEKKLSR